MCIAVTTVDETHQHAQQPHFFSHGWVVNVTPDVRQETVSLDIKIHPVCFVCGDCLHCVRLNRRMLTILIEKKSCLTGPGFMTLVLQTDLHLAERVQGTCSHR